MRILWFTNTPSNASEEFGFKRFGGGWISSLETLVSKSSKYEIGVCFLYRGKDFKTIVKGNVSYYGIPIASKGKFRAYIDKISGNLESCNSKFFDEVLRLFQPDIVHVFGTEMGYGTILKDKFDKVVFHLQGLTAPYSSVYFPLRIKKFDIIFNTGLFQLLKGNSFIHKYKSFNKRGLREVDIVRSWKYFMGRTEWDRNYIKLLNENAIYFHCDELIRNSFFNNRWIPRTLDEEKSIVIGTTINPNIYKGLDLIYKSLEKLGRYKIKWKIFGIKRTDYVNELTVKALKVGTVANSLHFYGQISEDVLISHLEECNFFVHPSYIDNSPNSVCEAMMLGMPVLSSSVGGVKTLIQHGVNGFLFNPYDEYDLAGLISFLIDNYDVALGVIEQARQDALVRHDPSKVLDQLDKVYTSMLSI